MSLINTTYPITGTTGSFSKNVFPSQKPLYFTATRQDQTIDSISSGTNGVVRINCASEIRAELGDYVVWGANSYSSRSSLVINVIDDFTIEVEDVFIGSDVSSSFINYLKDYFLEIRYVRASSISNNPNAIEVIKDYTQVPSDINGAIQANIAVPSDQIEPSIITTSGEDNNLSYTYKIQYRESYEGNRSLAWVSPTVDAPILLIHAANDITVGFPDSAVTKIFAKGYPIYYSFSYSSINDANRNEITISIKQYDITQTLLSTIDNVVITDLNGIATVVVDPSDISSNTVYVEFEDSTAFLTGQYDPSQYDPAQYA